MVHHAVYTQVWAHADVVPHYTTFTIQKVDKKIQQKRLGDKKNMEVDLFSEESIDSIKQLKSNLLT